MAMNFNTPPYYNDYDEEKAFYDILFKPGLAVQARELSQIQSILQNQVSKFGDHVFRNGSVVIPGEVNFDNEAHFAKLDPTFDAVDVTTYLSLFEGKIVTGATTGVKAVVSITSENSAVVDNTTPTLYFRIESTGSDGETKRFVAGEDIIAYAVDNTTAKNHRITADQIGDYTVSIKNDVGVSTVYTEDPVNDVLGYSMRVEVKAGIYYINGRFITTPFLQLVVGQYSASGSARVGFEVVEEIITTSEDTTLLDPAQGSYNYAAPGADRYKVSVNLVNKDIDQTISTGITFVELIRIKDGAVLTKISKSSYAELEKTMARRTHDESGSYEVSKFLVNTREHLDNGSNFGLYPQDPQDINTIAGKTYGDANKFVVSISSGKAYVEGYEIEAIAPQFIDIDKAREDSQGNENGHVHREDEYPVSTPVGTYVLVDNVANGMFNVANNGFELVDLVGEYQFDTAYVGASAANQLKVGTARVKFISLHSSDYTGNPQYKLGLFDVVLDSGKNFTKDVKGIRRKNLGGLPSTGANIIPTTENVKTGSVSVTGTAVTGSGTLFVEEFNVGDLIVINGTVVGKVTVIVSQTSMTVDNVNSVAEAGRIQVFESTFRDKEYQDLIFKTGAEFVRTLKGWDGFDDTELNMDLSVQRMQTQQTDGSGVFQLALPSNENFLSDQTLSNYLLVEGGINDTSAPVVAIDSGDISFDGPRTTITISGLTPSATHTLYYGVRLNGGTPSNSRTKVLVENYGHIVTGQKSAAALNIALAHADVLRIKDIRVSPGSYDTYTEVGSISIVNNYSLDNGQRPTHYQTGKITLQPGISIPATGALKIIYDYFDSTAGTGTYFSVDSYSGIPYEDIPYTSLNTGESVRVSDIIDFRPIISGLNAMNTSLPIIGTDFSSSISYYLGRKDKVYLSSEGVFNTVTGVPSISPQAPADPQSGLVLATIDVSPYTLKSTDVKVVQKDNRRYTMHDIGDIDRRLAEVERYIKLSELESKTVNLNITDINGDLNFKNGFMTDAFSDHTSGDVSHPDYKVSIDKVNKVLRPLHFTTDLTLLEDIGSPAERTWAISKDGKIITMAPTGEVAVVNNPYSSRSIDVNPFKSAGFVSTISMFPDSDMWKDTNRLPDFNVTDNNNTAVITELGNRLRDISGTQWNEWETQWSGAQRASTIGTSNGVWNTFTTTVTESGTTSRTGERIGEASLDTNSQDYGDRVIDMTYTPFMRARPIVVMADNLKSDTKFWPFFDNVGVEAYVQPADVFTLSAPGGLDLDPNTLMDDVIPNVAERSYNGVQEPAYSFGDILKGPSAANTTISSITSVNATSFDVVVASATNIGVGHHVVVYDLASMDSNTNYGVTLTSSATITDAANTSRQLNLRKFKVTAVAGTTLTLQEVDGSAVGSFDAYVPGSYSAGSGKLIRLQASGIVCKQGVINTVDGALVTSRDVYVVNVKGGFSVGETLTGTLGTPVNSVTLDAINGGSTPKAIGELMRTDADGSCVGTFFLPSNDTLSFRTGERKFKLIDNRINNDAEFDSKGEGTYHSIGFTIQKERTVVNSRSVDFATEMLEQSRNVSRVSSVTRRVVAVPRPSTQPIRNWRDPLAQSFTTREPMMVSSIDLYFEEAGSHPIVVEIRTTDTGIPSSKVIPGTQVTKQSYEINTSLDSSAVTQFRFDAPVYLKEGETYAVLVRCVESGARLFASEVGKTDILTQDVIVNNPLTGSLYMSQNTIEWEIYPLLDMKIRINKAQYAVGTQVVKLVAESPKPMTLEADPFEIVVQAAPTRSGVVDDGTVGWPLIRVYAPNHGLKAGQLVTISNVTSGVYGGGDGLNGIPHTALNNTFTVADPLNDELNQKGIDANNFIIKINPTHMIGVVGDLVHGFYGGSNIIITRQLDMDVFKYTCNDVTPPGTTLQYKALARNAARASTGLISFVANSNYFWPTRKLVMNAANEAAIDGLDSFEFQVTMTNNSVNLSPVIDLSRSSVFVTSNIINNGALNAPWVDEFDVRVLFDQDTLDITNAVTVGQGLITTSDASTTITGDVNTIFNTEVKVGYDVYRSSDSSLLGQVATITDADTMDLVDLAPVTIASPEAYFITTKHQVIFANEGVHGVIITSIDAADNILELTTAGNPIIISGVGTGIDGSYLVHDVVVSADDERVANLDQEIVKIRLQSVYASPVQHTVDGINNKVITNFSLPLTTSTASTAVNGAAGSKFLTETQVGDILVDEQGLVIGTVLTVDSDVVLNLDANANYTLTDATVGIQSDLTTYSIAEVYGFAADNAPSGSYNFSNYVSKELELTLPADSLMVKFQANIPSNTDIDVFYRVGSASEKLTDKIWIDSGFINTGYHPENSFFDKTIDLKDIGQFERVSIKICLKSLRPVSVPKLKNLQVVAYS